MQRKIILPLCALLVPQAVMAGVENRPGNVDDAYVMDSGTAYVAFGAAHVEENDGSKSTDLPLNFGFGINQYIEVTADMAWSRLEAENGDSENGIGDLTLRPEIVVVTESGSAPQISFAATLKFDSGDEYIGSGTTDYGMFLNVSKAFGDTKLHWNIGYNFLEDAENTLFLGSAFEHDISEALTLIGEIWAELPIDSNGDDEIVEVLGGAAYSLNDSLTVDFGVGTGLLDNNVDFRFTTGLTYEF